MCIRDSLHIAVWDDDLRECSARGYVRGAEDGSVVLTPEGAHAALITELTAGVHEDLLAELEDHLYDRRYDTAVREAAIRVELALRTASGRAAHGQALIEQCFGENGALVPRRLSNADRLALRSAFRSYFAYVRNEYAHNIPQTDLLTACRLVRRSSDLLRAVEILVRAVRPA